MRATASYWLTTTISSVRVPPPDLHSLPLAPLAGLGVVALWAAGVLVLGGVLLRLRDV
jgi:hypothetical protein